MKKVIFLLIVLGALIGVAFVTRDTSENRLKPAAAREKLLPDLDVNSVRKVRLKEGDKTATIALTGEQWTLAERNNYPAAFEKIGKLLVELKDQKTGKQRTIGKGAWGDLKLNTPGEGKDDESGLLIELLGDNDKPIRSLILGKNMSSSTVGKEASPFGGGGNERYVRVNDDGSAVWVVDNQFYETQARVEDWIDKSFIDVSHIKQVEITTPKAEDNWKASRKDEETQDFTLLEAKSGETLDAGKAPLSGLLASAAFTDVLSKDKTTADFLKDAWTAKVTTFDGFIYTFKVLKKGAGSEEKHYLSVTVSSDFPKVRTPGKDEKPEDKKKKDDEFAATRKTLEEKLAKEKKFEGWVYEVSSYTVSSLLKKRSEVLTDKPAPAPAPGAPVPPTAPSPLAPAKAPISVTTPPIAVPPPVPAPAPAKPELKEPAKDPLPATPKPEEPKK